MLKHGALGQKIYLKFGFQDSTNYASINNVENIDLIFLKIADQSYLVKIIVIMQNYNILCLLLYYCMLIR